MPAIIIAHCRHAVHVFGWEPRANPKSSIAKCSTCGRYAAENHTSVQSRLLITQLPSMVAAQARATMFKSTDRCTEEITKLFLRLHHIIGYHQNCCVSCTLYHLHSRHRRIVPYACSAYFSVSSGMLFIPGCCC
jgi:hypothetical protein